MNITIELATLFQVAGWLITVTTVVATLRSSLNLVKRELQEVAEKVDTCAQKIDKHENLLLDLQWAVGFKKKPNGNGAQ